MKSVEWRELRRMTGSAPLLIERVRVVETGLAVEAAIELPPLAQLDEADQVFIAAFVRAHGSIRQMEQHMGVSYPTIKARLNRLTAQLDKLGLFPSVAPPDDAPDAPAPGGTPSRPRPGTTAPAAPAATTGDAVQLVLDRLERGQIHADQAAQLLRQLPATDRTTTTP